MEQYDNKYECIKCGGANEIGRTVVDGGYISECSTTCKDCGNESYWSYGYFESEN